MSRLRATTMTTPDDIPDQDPEGRLDEVTWARVRSAYGRALDIAAADRERWLVDRRAQDPALWREVTSLLRRTDEASQDPGPDRPAHPEHIGGYRVLDVLGEGGMGVVYRAEQDHPAREVALKLVRPERASGSVLKRFAFEFSND